MNGAGGEAGDGAEEKSLGDQPAGKAIRRARLVSYLLIFAASAILLAQATTLKPSRWEVLGPGAFPQFVFGLLCVLSGAAAVQSALGGALDGWRGAPAEAARWMGRRRLVLGLIGLFAVYLGIMPLVGFAIATFLFLISATAMLAPWTRRAAVLALILALLFSFGLQALFSEVFDVFLPRWRL